MMIITPFYNVSMNRDKNKNLRADITVLINLVYRMIFFLKKEKKNNFMQVPKMLRTK